MSDIPLLPALGVVGAFVGIVYFLRRREVALVREGFARAGDPSARIGGAWIKQVVHGTLSGRAVDYEIHQGSKTTAGSSTATLPFAAGALDFEIHLSAQGERDTQLVQRGLEIDVSVGDPDFDDTVVVEAAPAEVARAVLDAPTRASVRAYMPCQLSAAGGKITLVKNHKITDPAAVAEALALVTRFAARVEAAVAELAEDRREDALGAGAYRGAVESPAARARDREELERLRGLRAGRFHEPAPPHVRVDGRPHRALGRLRVAQVLGEPLDLAARAGLRRARALSLPAGGSFGRRVGASVGRVGASVGRVGASVGGAELRQAGGTLPQAGESFRRSVGASAGRRNASAARRELPQARGSFGRQEERFRRREKASVGRTELRQAGGSFRRRERASVGGTEIRQAGGTLPQAGGSFRRRDGASAGRRNASAGRRELGRRVGASAGARELRVGGSELRSERRSFRRREGASAGGRARTARAWLRCY